jgi:hypothetical protein
LPGKETLNEGKIVLMEVVLFEATLVSYGYQPDAPFLDYEKRHKTE